ncbi:MAG: hypothetical protein LBF88_09705 [Planctomycetaceae bacterium]|jgi:hypothetical protein|nr:hypothetical protein [Planctomycetaceae bacterium]
MMKNFCFVLVLCFSLLVLTFEIAGGEEVSAQPRLGPGTLITIQPDINYASAYNRADMVEVLAMLPDIPPELADDVRFNKEIWAKEIRYQRDIWCLQFSFKPVRIISVDIPNKEGSFDKKAVWYLVYNVKNVGSAKLEKITEERTIITDNGERKLTKVEFENANSGGSISTAVETKLETPIFHDTVVVSDVAGTSVPQTRDRELVLRNTPGIFEPQAGKDEPIQFVPLFLLTTDNLVQETITNNQPETGRVKTQTKTIAVSYLDQIIPLALPKIMQREGMKAVPETTVSITRKPIASGQDLWGVALWTDIDPKIHRFSIYISGLTNAYQWSDEGTNTGKPGEGRTMKRKVLKTNWWRIGDQYNLNDSQIQYGYPGEIDFEWIFL